MINSQQFFALNLNDLSILMYIYMILWNSKPVQCSIQAVRFTAQLPDAVSTTAKCAQC